MSCNSRVERGQPPGGPRVDCSSVPLPGPTVTTSPRPCGSPNSESAPHPLIIVCKLVLFVRRPPAFLVDVSLRFPAFIYVTEPLQTQQSWTHLFPRGKSYSQHLNFLQGHNGMPACQPVSLLNTLSPHRPSVNFLMPMSPHITPDKSFSSSLKVRPKSTVPTWLQGIP